MTHLNRRFLFCILAVFTASPICLPGQAKSDPVAASNNTFRAGALSFSLPSPGNNLVEPGPDYRVLLEPLAPDSNRLVAAFVQPDVLDVLHKGTFPPLHDYALVEIPRRAEFVDVDENSFKQIVDSFGTQFGAVLSGSMKDQQEELDHRLKALGSKDSVTLDKPLPLGLLFSKPDAWGYGTVMPFTAKEGTVKVAVAITVFRIHNRVLLTYFYTPYKDESTVSQLRTTDEQWTDAILKANR